MFEVIKPSLPSGYTLYEHSLQQHQKRRAFVLTKDSAGKQIRPAVDPRQQQLDLSNRIRRISPTSKSGLGLS